MTAHMRAWHLEATFSMESFFLLIKVCRKRKSEDGKYLTFASISLTFFLVGYTSLAQSTSLISNKNVFGSCFNTCISLLLRKKAPPLCLFHLSELAKNLISSHTECHNELISAVYFFYKSRSRFTRSRSRSFY